MKTLIGQALGTFALVLGGCGAIAVDARFGGIGHVGVSVAFGLVVMVMIYALGHVSGAHLNPAATAAFAVARHFPWRRVPEYWLAQVAGAVTAAAFLRLTLGDGPLGVTQPGGRAVQAIAWEFVMTAVLMSVITSVATDTRAIGQAAAIAIGGTVGLMALVGGPVSGASMNPARSLGPAIVSGNLADIGVYVAGPVAGAVTGALLYGLLRSDAKLSARTSRPLPSAAGRVEP